MLQIYQIRNSWIEVSGILTHIFSDYLSIKVLMRGRPALQPRLTEHLGTFSRFSVILSDGCLFIGIATYPNIPPLKRFCLFILRNSFAPTTITLYFPTCSFLNFMHFFRLLLISPPSQPLLPHGFCFLPFLPKDYFCFLAEVDAQGL